MDHGSIQKFLSFGLCSQKFSAIVGLSSQGSAHTNKERCIHNLQKTAKSLLPFGNIVASSSSEATTDRVSLHQNDTSSTKSCLTINNIEIIDSNRRFGHFQSLFTCKNTTMTGGEDFR